MFRRRGGSFKYHFSAHIDRVTLRDGVACPPGFHFAVVWRKGGKVAMTHAASVGESLTVSFDEELSLVSTMYRDASAGAPRGGNFQPKEASFTLLHCRDGKPISSAKPLGRSKLNLAQHAGLETTSTELALVLLHDGVPVGDLHLTLASRWLKNYSRKEGSDGGGSLVSGDSGSDASSFSDAGSDTSGWPGGESGCDTDADFSDAGSIRADDDEATDGLADPDTEDEIEAMERAHSALAKADPDGAAGYVANRAAGAPGAPGASPAGAPTAARLITIPRLRFGGGKSGGGGASASGGKAAQAALGVMEERVAVLEAELRDTQEAGLKAYSEAEAAEESVAAMKAELDAAQHAVVAREAAAAEAAAGAAQAAAAQAAAAQATEAAAAATAAELREQLSKLTQEHEATCDKLDAQQEALRCLEALSASATSDGEDVRQQLVESAAVQAKLEAAVARSDAALAASEGGVAEAMAHAAILRAEADALTSELVAARACADARQHEAAQAAAELAALSTEAARAAAREGSVVNQLARSRADLEASGRARGRALVDHSSVVAALLSRDPAEASADGGASAAAAGLAPLVADKVRNLPVAPSFHELR